MNIKKQKGHTLLEVLAVVTIIALAAYLAAPMYTKVIRQSDASEAVKNMEMFVAAQGKYFIQNGEYANSLEDLGTPLRDSEGNIYSPNFEYSLGDQGEDNYCVYAESKNKNYILARNYKTSSEVLCSGADCDKVESIAKQGSLTALCGSMYNDICDLTCPDYKPLNEKFCVCECEEECKDNFIQDEETCQCKCNPAVAANCKGDNKKYDEKECSCKCVQTLVCGKGAIFNPLTCKCESILGGDCPGVVCKEGTTLNTITCQCDKVALKPCSNKCPEGYTPNPITCECEKDGSICEISQRICEANDGTFYEDECSCECSSTALKECSGENKILTDDCSCNCKEKLECSEGYSFNSTTCECELECELDQKTCEDNGGDFNLAKCQCTCNEESIKSCSNENQILQDDCSCECNGAEECKENFAWSDSSCSCECNLTTESCHKQNENWVLKEGCECGCETVLACKKNQVWDSIECKCKKNKV